MLDTTLVGFTMINGTWGLQLALLVASLFNYFINPAPDPPRDPAISIEEYDLEINTLNFTRMIVIPASHALLTIFCFISSSDRIPWEGLKQGLAFLGMVIYTVMILQASSAMIYYHYPLQPGQVDTQQMKASYLWLIIEQLVFVGLIVSNMTFLAIRSCVRHKL